MRNAFAAVVLLLLAGAARAEEKVVFRVTTLNKQLAEIPVAGALFAVNDVPVATATGSDGFASIPVHVGDRIVATRPDHLGFATAYNGRNTMVVLRPVDGPDDVEYIRNFIFPEFPQHGNSGRIVRVPDGIVWVVPPTGKSFKVYQRAAKRAEAVMGGPKLVVVRPEDVPPDAEDNGAVVYCAINKNSKLFRTQGYVGGHSDVVKQVRYASTELSITFPNGFFAGDEDAIFHELLHALGVHAHSPYAGARGRAMLGPLDRNMTPTPWEALHIRFLSYRAPGTRLAGLVEVDPSAEAVLAVAARAADAGFAGGRPR